MIGYTYSPVSGTEKECCFIKNLQGDVERIVTETGSLIAQYTYDAWGNVLTGSGTFRNINPIRYRGYYFDTETGLYYLRSRYYDPQVGRFINADVLADTDRGSAGLNLFAYCLDDPVNNLDSEGLDTEAIGISDALAFGLRLSGGVQVVKDDKGNYGIIIYSGVGGGTPSASIGITFTQTGANSIDDLVNWGGSAGLSSIWSIFGTDVNVGEGWIGETFSLGVGVPILEVHGEITNTVFIFQIGPEITEPFVHRYKYDNYYRSTE